MNTKPNTGEQPAFPWTPPAQEILAAVQSTTTPEQYKDFLESLSGMNIRAYFAGQALPVVIRNAEVSNEQCRCCSSYVRLTEQDVAQSCCKYADALVAELSKEVK